MKEQPLFNFKVNKETNTIHVEREFATALPLVWDAFTKPEILDQWWAPKPWKSITKYMDFKVGGRRFYAMVSPEGQEHWSTQDFTAINPKSHFKFVDAFADQDENLNPDLPSSEWELNFSSENGVTLVSITVKHKSSANLEQMMLMGFEGGFTMTLNELETILQSSR